MPLVECKEYMDLVIGWYTEAWGYLRPEDPSYAEKLYQRRLNTDSLPIAYIVFQELDPVGTFSLVPNTFAMGNPKITMMNNVFVTSHKRGFGIGKEIIKLAETTAEKTFKLEALQLGTVEAGLVNYYEKLGWHFTAEAKLGSHIVYMMEKHWLSLNNDKTRLFANTEIKPELGKTLINEVRSKL